MRVQHQNIVRLVGYCNETHDKHIEHNGELIFCKVNERALCFEYLQGGSLDEHVSGKIMHCIGNIIMREEKKSH
jgi:serine/threonine protein kinase